MYNVIYTFNRERFLWGGPVSGAGDWKAICACYVLRK